MKKVLVKYGGFESEQEVEENLYNAIYEHGREDERAKVIEELKKWAKENYILKQHWKENFSNELVTELLVNYKELISALEQIGEKNEESFS